MAGTVRNDTMKVSPRPSVRTAVRSPAVFVRRGDAWSEVQAQDEGHTRIRLGGLFQTAWMAAVCGRLADLSISIEQAHARITHDGSWNVELNVRRLPGAPDPASLDLIALTEAQAPAETTALRLARYELTESRDHDAPLHLAIEADDALGLLGSLLVALAQLALFPIEMHIETREGRAFDSLWLGRSDGEVPSSAIRSALEQLLTASTQHP